MQIHVWNMHLTIIIIANISPDEPDTVFMSR